MNKKFYRLNRVNLIASLPYEKCMVVLSSGYEINRSADENYEFQVNNNFYYLTGIKQPNVHLIIIKDNDKHMEVLYIDEYDVIANHAASIGSISKEDLFYLMSRGLDEKEASKLIVLGFVQPLLDKIDNASLKEEISKEFEKNL